MAEAGLIRSDDKDFIHLNNAAFVPREDFDDLAYYFGRNLRDHIAASGHNLLGDTPPMLERAVYYEKLTPQSIAEVGGLYPKARHADIGDGQQKGLRVSTAR